MLTKILRNCAGHNFTIYLETSENANVYSKMSTLDSYIFYLNTSWWCLHRRRNIYSV